MGCLILRNADGQEIGRRDMDEHERYDLYRCCSEHELLTFGHARYRVETVAWRIPEAHCICQVIFDSWEPTEQPFDC